MAVTFMEQKLLKQTVIQSFCFGHPLKSHSVKMYVAIVSFLETAMNNTELHFSGQEIHISCSQQLQKKMVSILAEMKYCSRFSYIHSSKNYTTTIRLI